MWSSVPDRLEQPLISHLSEPTRAQAQLEILYSTFRPLMPLLGPKVSSRISVAVVHFSPHQMEGKAALAATLNGFQ